MKVKGIDHTFGTIESRMRNSLTREGAKLRETEKFTTLGCISNSDTIMIDRLIREFGIITDALAKSAANCIGLTEFGRRRCITRI